MNSNYKEMLKFITKYEPDLTIKNIQGLTPLTIAAKYGYKHVKLKSLSVKENTRNYC